jgi:hypothetical protein
VSARTGASYWFTAHPMFASGFFASRRGTAASSEWCVIREGDTYFARVERSLLSNSLSACLGQPTSKGESIGSRSVLDSNQFCRDFAIWRACATTDVMIARRFNVLAVGMVPAYLFAKADLEGSMTEASIDLQQPTFRRRIRLHR